MTSTNFDLAIIGGGAGGISAARAARRRGASVAIVQDGRMGGDCTFTGCVPSKALLAAAARGATFDAAIAAVHDSIATISTAEDASALDREGIAVIAGRGHIRSPTAIEVEGTTLRCGRMIIATGGTALVPPIMGLATTPFLTNETLFDLTQRPASLAILGGGPIGCEMAQGFARLGTAVTLIEALDRILPREEPEVSPIVAAALERDGVDVRTGSGVIAVEATAGGVRLLFGDGAAPVEAEQLLVAIGRAPSGRGFGLEEVGVEVNGRGAVVVDDTLQTAVKGIWAIGDVTGRLPFTHVAAKMGFIAVRNAFDRAARLRPTKFDTAAIPWATFTDPEVAHVGMTEADAATIGGKVAELPFAELDRAITAGRTEGFAKIIAAPRRLTGWAGGGRIVGATIVGPTAGELIHEPTLAIETAMFTGRLAQTTHAYPTWSMAIQQTAAQFFFEQDGRTARPATAR